jgi:hypothetical protein
MSRDQAPSEDQFPELTPFEASLAALAPRAAGLDREALFFQAGQAAALRDLSDRRSAWTRWGWPAAFSAMTAVAATLLAMLQLRGEPSMAPSAGMTSPQMAAAPAESIVLPDREPRQDDPPTGPASYSRLREEVLRHGIDAYPTEKVVLSESTAIASGPLSYRELLAQILQEK